MEVYQDIKNVVRQPEAVLTVGSFDGLHLGHQFVLEELKARSRAVGAMSTLVTFKPHPKFVIGGGEDPDFRVLTTIAEKINILESLGLERLVVVPFTEEFAKTSAEEFIESILFERIGFKEIIVGYDHAFGRNREGNSDTFRRLGTKLNFAVTELEAVRGDDTEISSTEIRRLLHEGRVENVMSKLGRYYFMIGSVVKGEGRGAEFGFPTANLELGDEKKLVPANGVYAVLVSLEGKKYKGMMNIGVRPTFDETQKISEVHIFDFDRRIYTRKLKVEFVQKIRNEQRFDGASKLVGQLKLDKIKSVQILSNC